MSTINRSTAYRRNPDVLSCIANLSSDEIFTPPEFAKQILDNLEIAWARSYGGEVIWENPYLRFLDPCSKSGVFLREITERLTNGLKHKIPDIQERVDHILEYQVFGIAITELTGMISRRSLYCSKDATGKHSIATKLGEAKGKIWFERTEHTWKRGKCKYCGAKSLIFDRSSDLETHAYAFIHTDDIKTQVSKLFGGNMQFDVIIGNPPYQLGDGGYGTSAAPIYQKFVDQAKKLNPRMLTMVIPSRWFAGGKGLDEFRASMLSDKRLRSIDDFLHAAEVFPGTEVKGGICYFLWDRDNPGMCKVTTHYGDWPETTSDRDLREEGLDIFIRFEAGVSILKKIVKHEGGGRAFVA